MLTRMKRRLPALVGVLALVAAFLVATSGSAPPAHADGCTTVEVTRNGDTICVIVGQTGGGGGGGSGNGVNIDCSNNGTIVWNGQTFQCDLDGWSFSGGCYIKPVDPQPPTNDPIWGSSDPSTNRAQWEDCTNIPPTQVGAKEIIGPCVGYCAGPNPVERIIGELQVPKPDLGMAPPGAAPGAPAQSGFVNENVWFWTKALDTSTQTRSAANVIGTRTFDSVDWKITRANKTAPDAVLHCESDVEYTPADGSAPSKDPACRYQFTAPDTYTITVTTTWTLVITQNGAVNTQTITSVPNTAVITINEGQSING
jgi:hypothetical protein